MATTNNPTSYTAQLTTHTVQLTITPQAQKLARKAAHKAAVLACTGITNTVQHTAAYVAAYNVAYTQALCGYASTPTRGLVTVAPLPITKPHAQYGN